MPTRIGYTITPELLFSGSLCVRRRCYESFAERAEDLPTDGYGDPVRRGVAGGLGRTGRKEEKGSP